MTLKQALESARHILAASDIEEAALESELLLRQVLKIGRVQLYLELDNELTKKQEEGLRRLTQRRLKGEPNAYITGHREFYGHDFRVDGRVLIPRPESELLVDRVISLARGYHAPIIADIGTGCGAIAISLALELPQAKVYASDISAAALEVARANCQKHGVADRVCLLQGDMLKPLPEPVDLIVANLPYVRRQEVNDNHFEPSLALNGGRYGTKQIGRLCLEARSRLRPGGGLLLEIGQGQEKAVTSRLKRLFPRAKIEVVPDLAGTARVVTAVLSAEP